MKKTKTLYMAYGSNLNLRQMAYRCPTAKVVGTAMLDGYQMIFNHVATIVPKDGAVVPVAVWEIDDVCEAALDRYEGYPHLYRKEYLSLDVGGKKRNVMVYLMNAGRPAMPSMAYYRTIEEGYNDVGFDLVHLTKAIEATKNIYRRNSAAVPQRTAPQQTRGR